MILVVVISSRSSLEVGNSLKLLTIAGTTDNLWQLLKISRAKTFQASQKWPNLPKIAT